MIPGKTEPASGSAIDAHCRRVAVLADELMERLGWSPGDRAVVRQAVALHHSWPSLQHGWLRLTSPEGAARAADGGGFPDGTHRILEILGKSRQGARFSGDPMARKMAQLLELCCFYVERWEFNPYERADFPQSIRELVRLAEDGHLDHGHVELVSRLPVVDRAQVARLCASCARLGQEATDYLRRVASGRADAASSEAAVKLRLEEFLRPLFSFPATCEKSPYAAAALWSHSRQVALYAAALIEPTRERTEPAREREGRLAAYLAGLLHDIGRLVLNHLAPESAACFARMIAGGAECQFAELLLCGFDHCEAGVQVLRQWNLPEPFVEAIRHHHDPENTGEPLASILYLAEHQSASAEDAPSLARLHCAARRCGLSAGNMAFAEFAPLA